MSQDYNEAIQDPRHSFGDAELKTGAAVANPLGIPLPRSGNFADVYEVRCPSGSRWAVKCFTRQVSGLGERYSEIGKYLRLANLPFMVDFQYLEQGIRVRGQWYPILKMHWVEGFVLNEFVRDNLDKKPILNALGQIWLRMARRLRESYIAHCDLQHGNVMFVPGSTANSLAVKLIDYDGMCVPSLAGTKSGEVGHPAYQHPERLRSGAYNQEVDRFSLLSIATALRCLTIGGRALWEKYDNGDNLLFRQADLQAPTKSALFQELLAIRDPLAQTLVKELHGACRGPLDAVPLLTDLIPEEKAAVTVSTSAARQPAATQQPAWDFGHEPVAASAGKKRRASAGMPRWVWVVGGSLAACALLGGLLFWLLPSRHRPRDKAPVAQAPHMPPPVDDSKRKPPPPKDPLGDHPVPVADTPKEPLPLFQDDFHNPKSGWPVAKDKPGTEMGYAEGKYHIRRMGWTSSVWNAPFNSPADFVCEVEGRSSGQEGDGWGLSIYGKEGGKQYGIQVTVPASGKVEIAPSAHLPSAKEGGPKRGPIEHAAIKRGAEWNTLRVVVRGRRVEVHMNGVRLVEPFEVDRTIAPGDLALMSFGSSGEGLAEFRRFTVWPAGLASAKGLDPSKGEQARNAWLYKVSGKDGWFRSETDKSWIETTPDGGQCQFEELSRPANYVELFDRNRTMWLRLYSDRVELRQGDNPQWYRLYSGRWVAGGDLPKPKKRAEPQRRP